MSEMKEDDCVVGTVVLSRNDTFTLLHMKDVTKQEEST